ncbi:predicted rhamnulose-1-phosphate aldolase [Paenibacillus sp. JCM 10914]|nr:predicted rhamnulose-1-phosphate aldolase [Paenibacillus sp. JCM 10914]
MVQSLWEQAKAQQASNTLDELVYRSNLIGTDRRVCNWAGQHIE